MKITPVPLNLTEKMMWDLLDEKLPWNKGGIRKRIEILRKYQPVKGITKEKLEQLYIDIQCL